VGSESPQGMTILDRLVELLRLARTYNRHDLSEPRAIIWTDGDQAWNKVIPLLQDGMPELLVLHTDRTGDRVGPSTRIRYLLARGEWRDPPVVYLPGISRQAFRGAAGFPDAARHLFALQYQGQFWNQTNGKDWTPFAFLSSEQGGLGLDVARDEATKVALTEQLESLLRAPLADLLGRRLEASDFHSLSAGDPVGSLLRWMSSPELAQQGWKAGEWKGFCAICKQTFGLDPEKDGVITAAERLVAGVGPWGQVWQRFREAPKTFGGVRKALELVKPRDLFDAESERIPANNRQREETLRADLVEIAKLPANKALDRLKSLVTEHVKRADWVWADLGEAPLALASVHMLRMLDAIQAGLPGVEWQAMADAYLAKGWVADASAWRALDAVRDMRDYLGVSTALRAVYWPWLEELAQRAARAVSTYPNRAPANARAFEPESGTILLFVDGLRCDLGLELRRMLEEDGLQVGFDTRWSALPTVTATAKPAWRPLGEHLQGETITEAFEPRQKDDGRVLKTQEFRQLVTTLGFTYTDPLEIGDPTLSAWTEAGAFDHYGHDQGSKLAWRIDEELRSILVRVRELLHGGWKKVIVLTDHGWLMLPFGLPKVDLPKHLTLCRWGRCALAQPGAQHKLPQVSWFWGGHESVVLAPGVAAFKEGLEYAHGGLTLQEALTPLLIVQAGKQLQVAVSITEAKWRGLRLDVQLSDASPNLQVDLRTKAADSSSSVLKGKKPIGLGGRGTVTMLVEDTDLLGSAAILVVLAQGQVVCKQPVTIGEN